MPRRRTPPAVPPEARRHVADVLGFLLRPEELEDWQLHWVRPDGAWLLVTDVVACGEHCRVPITGWGPADRIEEGLDMFTDSLEDFISESRFAWGQQREMHDRPWHPTD